VLTIGTIILLIIASFLVLIGDLIIKLALQQNWGELLSISWHVLGWILVIGILIVSLAFIEYIYYSENPPNTSGVKLISIFVTFAITAISLKIVDIFFLWMQTLINSLEIDRQVESLLLNIWQILSWLVALGIVATAFAFIYRFGPSRWLPGTPILPGAILAALSWAGVSALFKLYVSNFGHYNKVYGAVGAVIVLMLWLYLSALIMLFGDQLNATVGEVMREKN
jgi:membrane protein